MHGIEGEREKTINNIVEQYTDIILDFIFFQIM